MLKQKQNCRQRAPLLNYSREGIRLSSVNNILMGISGFVAIGQMGGIAEINKAFTQAGSVLSHVQLSVATPESKIPIGCFFTISYKKMTIPQRMVTDINIFVLFDTQFRLYKRHNIGAFGFINIKKGCNTVNICKPVFLAYILYCLVNFGINRLE